MDPDFLEMDTHARVVEAFMIMQISGGAGLFIILATAVFSRNVHRYTTWYSFCASWAFSCISYSLLAFSGQQTRTMPDFNLCVVQAALIYAAPVLTGSTTLSFMMHMAFSVKSVLSSRPLKTKPIVILVLLVGPYLAWLAMFVGVLVYELNNPITIRKSPNGTYCDSTSAISRISALVVVACTSVLLSVEVVIGVILYRNRRLITDSSQSVTMVFRIMVFSFAGVLCLGLGVAYTVTSKHDQTFDMILAALPVLVVLIFGTQLDLVRAWMFWRRTPAAPQDVPKFTRRGTYTPIPLDASNARTS